MRTKVEVGIFHSVGKRSRWGFRFILVLRLLFPKLVDVSTGAFLSVAEAIAA